MISPTTIRAATRGDKLATVTEYFDGRHSCVNHPLAFQIYTVESTGKVSLDHSELFDHQTSALDRFQTWVNS